MKSFIAALALAFVCFTIGTWTPQDAYAAEGIIPWNVEGSCTGVEFDPQSGMPKLPAKIEALKESDPEAYLGYKMRCGTVSLSDVPKQVVHWINLVLKILPSIGVAMVIFGGIYYIYGSATDSKEKGWDAITYAILGLVVAFTSWWLVDWIQVWLTS